MPKRKSATATTAAATAEVRAIRKRSCKTDDDDGKPPAQEKTETVLENNVKTEEVFGEEEEKLEWSESLRSVVKVFCTMTKTNFRMPWQMESQRSCTGSGCLLTKRRIVTNAHVVNFGSTITLLKHGNPKRFLCRIVSYGHEYDLALLEVEEDESDEFWDGVVPFDLGTLPPLNAAVLMLGFPTNVDSVSVTEGIISRVMVDAYRHSGEVLLKLQVDAAINPGNSGGPAIVNGKLIGIASELQKNSQNIGFAIPASVVEHFLLQIERAKITNPDQHYPGICNLGITWTPCDNPSQRGFYKLDAKEHGVVVTHVLPLSDCFSILKRNDILMNVDGQNIADDGTIELRRSGERVRWTHVVSKHFARDNITITFKRDGKIMSDEVTLTGTAIRYTSEKQLDKPQYVIWAGLVFLQCSNAYLEEEFVSEDGEDLDYESMPLNLQNAWYRNEKKTTDQEVVILSQVLGDNLTVGYTNYKNRVVESVNNTKIQNLAQLSTMLNNLDSKTDPFVSVEIDQSNCIILDTTKSIKAHPIILARNNIHKPYSLSTTK